MATPVNAVGGLPVATAPVAADSVNYNIEVGVIPCLTAHIERSCSSIPVSRLVTTVPMAVCPPNQTPVETIGSDPMRLAA